MTELEELLRRPTWPRRTFDERAWFRAWAAYLEDGHHCPRCWQSLRHWLGLT